MAWKAIFNCLRGRPCVLMKCNVQPHWFCSPIPVTAMCIILVVSYHSSLFFTPHIKKIVAKTSCEINCFSSRGSLLL
jgi:hypothetical protein